MGAFFGGAGWDEGRSVGCEGVRGADYVCSVPIGRV